MKKQLSGRKILAFITILIVLFSTNLFRSSAAGSVGGGANGATAGATATVGGLPVSATLTSAAPVTLPSTGGNVSDQVASVGLDLAGVATVLSTGVITNSTSGTINASTAHAESTSTVNGINILNGFITAGTITSKASSNGNGSSASSSGAGSIINNLRINGILQETSSVAPNTVISATGHITVVVGIVPVNVPLNATITLNAQSETGNGTTTSGISVAQLVVNVTGNVTGLVSLNVSVTIAIASSSVNFTAAPNTCPVVNVSGGTSRSVQVGQTLNFNVSATDADGDTTTLQAANLPANSSFTPNPATGTPTATGTFSFTPAAGQANQTFNVQFTGSDNRGCSGSSPVPVTVQIQVTSAPPANNCPTVNVSGGTTRSVQAGQTLTFNVSATDPDGDSVTLQASNLPANSSFTPNPATGTPTATGAFSFTPAAGQANQTFNVQFTGSDTRGCSGSGASPVTVQINVTSGPPPNSCPTVTAPTTVQTVQVGQTLNFNVSATDPDGDTVTLQAANLPAHSSFTPNPATGTPTATGAFSFTPAAGQANQTFNVQFTGSDTRGCSGSGASPVTVQINVTSAPPPNSCPNLNAPSGTQTVQAGQTLTFNVSATDPDGDTVTLQASNLPANSSFTPNPATGTPTASGVFNFTPAAGQANQTFNVSFTATDNRGCSSAGTGNSRTIQINVTAPPANHCPTVTVPGATQTVQAGQTLTFNVSATDQDGDSVTLQASNLPANASFNPNPATGTPTASGTFTFTPVAGQANQTFNVQFTGSDNRGCSGGSVTPVTVQISVTPGPPPNRCPTVNAPSTVQTVQVGQTLNFNVSATDPDGDTVTLQAANLPAHSSFTPNPATGTPTATGAFSFTPAAGQANQTFNVQFTGSDTRGCSGSGASPVTVQINVTSGPPPNSCPTITVPGATQTIQVGQTLTFSVSATDPDGDTATLQASNLPANSSFTPNPATGTPTATGTFRFTPSAAQASQAFNVLFTASDNRGCSGGAPVTVQITVTPGGTPNLCPVITVANVAPSIQVGQILTFQVSATDPDGDTVTLQATNMPLGASFIPNPATGTPTVTGVFSFIPNASQANAVYNVHFTASDNRGCSGAGTVPVTVTITVFPPPSGGSNNCPILNAPTTIQSIQMGQALTFNVSATDPDGDTVTLSASNLPAGAIFTSNPAIGTPTANGVFGFIPTAAQANLTFNVTFTATDSRGCSISTPGSSNSRIVQINVVGSDGVGGSPGVCGNHAPIISVPALPFAGLGQTLTFLVRATDQDGDPVTVLADSLPENASFDSATGKVSFSPDLQQLHQAQLGQGSVAVFIAQDNKGAKSAAIVDITPVATESDPKAPLLSIPAGPVMVKVVDKLSFGVAALAQTDNCSAFVTASGLPASATFDSATNLFSFTPTAAQIGQSFVVRFTATDCAGRKKEASLRIIVTDADGNCVARGTGVADITVKRIDFSNTRVGDISGAATISLTNRGGGPLMVSSFTLSDDSSYSVEGLGVLPATLQPGGVIEFRILFMPKEKGTFNSVLTIFTSDPDTPATEIALKGKSTK
jgi:hypothetical protein